MTKQVCFECRTNRLLEDLRGNAPDLEDMCRDCEHNVAGYRVCFHCRVEKPLEEFNRNKGMPRGRGYECRTCSRERARNRQSSESTRELNRERSRQAYAERPEATEARAMILRLINLGFIERLPCQVCGERKTDGHHPDYSEPLRVIWLCRSHHWLVERILKGSDEAPVPVLFIHDYSSVEAAVAVC